MKGIAVFGLYIDKDSKIKSYILKLSFTIIAMSFFVGFGFVRAEVSSLDISETSHSHNEKDSQTISIDDNHKNSELEHLMEEYHNTPMEQINVDEDTFDMPVFMEENPFFTWKDIHHREENPIFTEGETLTYKVSWMGINAGTLTMKLDVQTDYNGKAVYQVTVTGETNKTFSTFFKVRDVFTSVMDPETFNSIYYSKNVREGKYRKFQETRYDQEQRKAWTGQSWRFCLGQH